MSFERPKGRFTSKERVQSSDEVFDERVEQLLDAFPRENRDRLVQRIVGKQLKEQVAILREGLFKRGEIIAGTKYRSQNLLIIEQQDADVPAELFNIDAESNEVGRGDNGRVIEYMTQESPDTIVVFKTLLRPAFSYQNDLLAEGSYQADAALFAGQHTEFRIGVPEPYYVVRAAKGYMLAMQKVPGLSVRDIITQNITLPDTIDLASIAQDLERFTRALNEAGFYHRDLREGNIMISLSPDTLVSKRAYMIDFGMCTKASSPEEAYRDIDTSKDYDTVSTVMSRLAEHQVALKAKKGV